MVILCTTTFIFEKFYVLPTVRITYFVRLSNQTAIIFLHSINVLVFVTETECVYCAVRIEASNKI